MSPPDAKPEVGLETGAHQLEALAARFRAPLMRYFERRVRTPEDAEELTHDVFVRLLRRTDVDQIDNIEGFVFITAANLLKDHYRARAHRRETQSVNGLDFASLAQNPAEEAEGKQEIGVLLGAIEALPPKCRAVFVMHRWVQTYASVCAGSLSTEKKPPRYATSRSAASARRARVSACKD